MKPSNRRRFGLRSQFILLIVFGLTIIFTVIAIFTIRVTTNNLRNSLVEQAKAFAALATQPIGTTFVTYKDSGTLKIEQQITRFTDLNTSISDVQIVDVKGNQVFEQGRDTSFRPTAEQAASFEPIYVNDGDTLEHIVYPYLEDFGGRRYSIVYTLSYASIDENIRELTTGIIALAVIALGVSILVAYVLINKLFVIPIGLVSMTALSISKGDFDKKIEPRRNDEIGDLAISVNTMAEALKADIRKLQEVDAIKTEFMMIASHNLRTPLTIIQGYLENLLSGSELSESARKTLEVVSASGNRLAVFAEDMLTVSRLEAGDNVLGSKERVNLKEFIKTLTKDFKPLVTEKGLELDVTSEDSDMMVSLSKSHFRAAIWNLLDNALKFTEKGKISIDLAKKESFAVVTVSDTGAGISEEEVPKLFTKFHRGTSTMLYNYEGTGIGLYLTKLIIDKHGGNISLRSTLGQGSQFIVQIPLETSNLNN